MIKVCDAPVHVMPPLLYTGVTVMIAVTGDKPVFTAVKLCILPVPLAARPMDGSLLTQANDSDPVGPVVGLVKLITAVGEPLHNIWLVTGLTIGVGLTVMVKDEDGPIQLFNVGVIVIVA